MALQNTTDTRTKINSTGNLTNNQKDTLREIAESNPKIVYASSDHTVNVSTTLANDAELYFACKAGRKYAIEGFLKVTTDATDGIKVAFSTGTDVTSGFVMYEYGVNSQVTLLTETQTDFTSPAPTGIAASITQIRVNGFVKTAADGFFRLQSALKADNNAATTIHLGSYLKIYEVA